MTLTAVKSYYEITGADGKVLPETFAATLRGLAEAHRVAAEEAQAGPVTLRRIAGGKVAWEREIPQQQPRRWKKRDAGHHDARPRKEKKSEVPQQPV